jgi:hypothetical protein
VDESDILNLSTLIHDVDPVPVFHGEVIFCNATVHFALVPEPSVFRL